MRLTLGSKSCKSQLPRQCGAQRLRLDQGNREAAATEGDRQGAAGDAGADNHDIKMPGISHSPATAAGSVISAIPATPVAWRTNSRFRARQDIQSRQREVAGQAEQRIGVHKERRHAVTELDGPVAGQAVAAAGKRCNSRQVARRQLPPQRPAPGLPPTPPHRAMPG